MSALSQVNAIDEARRFREQISRRADEADIRLARLTGQRDLMESREIEIEKKSDELEDSQ